MGKPTRTAEQWKALLLVRIERTPELRGQATDVHRGDVVWMDPGEGGPTEPCLC